MHAASKRRQWVLPSLQDGRAKQDRENVTCPICHAYAGFARLGRKLLVYSILHDTVINSSQKASNTTATSQARARMKSHAHLKVAQYLNKSYCRNGMLSRSAALNQLQAYQYIQTTGQDF